MSEIEIPFGAFDSELVYEEITIPDGFEATIEDKKIILKRKECEDERIRKAILNYFTKCWGNCKDDICGIHVEDVIAWLEKQGEQNPTDKVESKFHENMWITNGDYTWKIVDVKSLDYILQSQDGNIVDDTISYVDEQFHSFTIQDAKDGDVISFNDGHGNDSIELIKSITDKKIEFWFCLTNGNRYEVFDEITPYTNLTSRENATPATKEQRDLLFQTMKQFGYEWDEEKKELIRIEKQGEHKPTFRERYKNIAKSEWFKKTYEGISVSNDEKTKWTLRDEELCQDTLDAFEALANDLNPSVDYGELYDWLKSLKQRMEK